MTRGETLRLTRDVIDTFVYSQFSKYDCNNDDVSTRRQEIEDKLAELEDSISDYLYDFIKAFEKYDDKANMNPPDTLKNLGMSEKDFH